MRVLVGCEESQEITKAFRALGHEAYSCDLKPCSGGHPEWHIQGDVLEMIDDRTYQILIIHPPCTDICSSGAAHFAKKRADGRQAQSVAFFAECATAGIERVCIENPVGIMSGDQKYLKKYYPDAYNVLKYLPEPQFIQPYEFGHDASKRTCLWLKNLPELKKDPAQYVQPRMIDGKPRWANQTDSRQNRLGPSPERAAIRAKTYAGWANAMATQWSGL